MHFDNVILSSPKRFFDTSPAAAKHEGRFGCLPRRPSGIGIYTIITIMNVKKFCRLL